jgi:hypothetical protein
MGTHKFIPSKSSGTGGSVEVQDEGVVIDSTPDFINFTGNGVVATVNGLGVDVEIDGILNIDGGSAASVYLVSQSIDGGSA